MFLADEPVSNLDPDLTFRVLQIPCGRKHVKNSRTVVCVLHDPELVERFADHRNHFESGSAAGMDTSGGESWPGQCRRPTVRPAASPRPAIGYRTSRHHRLNITSVSLIIFLLAIGVFASGDARVGARFGSCGESRPLSQTLLSPDFSVSGQILEALIETIQIAVLATFFSILLAFPLAVAGAQTLSPRWLVAISRMIMNCIRTIPSLIWALIAVAVVGPLLAGVLGLSFYSLGYPGKFFGDAFNRSTSKSLAA